MHWPKVPYIFISREKFTRHSLTRFERILVFLFPLFGKKNTNCFIFFPRKSLQATHSKKIWYLQKKGQKKVLYAVFRNFSNFGGVFFFPFFSQKFSVFFFPRKSLKSTHSLKFKEPEKKKYSTGKKKTTFSLTHSIFDQKWQKLNFSREIKKYGTFGPAKSPLPPDIKKFSYKMIQKCHGVLSPRPPFLARKISQGGGGRDLAWILGYE